MMRALSLHKTAPHHPWLPRTPRLSGAIDHRMLQPAGVKGIHRNQGDSRLQKMGRIHSLGVSGMALKQLGHRLT
ncbi:uncharacterized protein MONOS_7570 [Monocercomonoides exilis]|uniref:uncharacterized protein n=1 Tax=Monocercomonoides exilis TaxID=2049356 RepID=UPI003559B5F7|nr:hypothetical protein MONOS_7570 [Monocercomonoides exilis]|eukprot:MONOS_7570.1-p1 / transcript=MONOS_7570.1 / gene=MONOS_7570 / organism=Monocercomonoides_exilis_PA203 / gene_product=unspecified product / transcript_product=unspecified product / location=Mono_scaffold00261:74737-74958(+) / protein_length=74 / sequence_SO=supercontig / SO=protein_coding / is_pseudo=false